MVAFLSFSRSLPRMAAMRKLSLKSPTTMSSGAEDSDSARDSLVKKRPPRRGESFVPTRMAGGSATLSDNVEAKEDELSTQLNRLAEYLNYREQVRFW